ncbi:archaeosortase B (VPXXXP-CTERM-specific) [Methanohalophilus levihalophilus]|uniref:archaeosortase B n=1 Tax=Methanohalophilus levihalophilus TaxID=1431282 RepID=UPI001AEA0CE4|nr:archaeosortase B [Methanohalophilus levihalophilus]MBP2031123.1 archaeosortase B (VPXXXP-CTERM-specific) [Methanohalophilus levihalophilus]
MGKKQRKKRENTKSLKLKLYELKDNRIARFVALYLIYISIFTGLYLLLKEDLEFLRNLTAGTFSYMMSSLGVANTVTENLLLFEEGAPALKVIDECTGIYEVLVYSSCVMAYTTTYQKKLMGIAFGIPVILGINMVRLICLGFVGIWYPDMFDYVHYYLWQVTLILIIVLVVLIWIEKIVKS